jgi:hypothetical protein
LPNRDRLFLCLSRASGRRGPRGPVAHILGGRLDRWQPDRSRFILRILYKRISPRKRFQHRLRCFHFIVPSKRHGVRLFWPIEIGTPNTPCACGRARSRRRAHGQLPSSARSAAVTSSTSCMKSDRPAPHHRASRCRRAARPAARFAFASPRANRARALAVLGRRFVGTLGTSGRLSAVFPENRSFPHAREARDGSASVCPHHQGIC